MKRSSILAILLTMFVFGSSTNLSAHCQIPCGIYGDNMRFEMWMEHITTIEKSMNQIIKLSKAETPNYNQIVRWVNNKDSHADNIMDIALNYFLAQRIKPLADQNDMAAKEIYAAQLETVHHIIVHAMKAKQTTDIQHVEALQSLVKKLYQLYFNEDMEHHLSEHDH